MKQSINLLVIGIILMLSSIIWMPASMLGFLIQFGISLIFITRALNLASKNK